MTPEIIHYTARELSSFTHRDHHTSVQGGAGTAQDAYTTAVMATQLDTNKLLLWSNNFFEDIRFGPVTTLGSTDSAFFMIKLFNLENEVEITDLTVTCSEPTLSVQTKTFTQEDFSKLLVGMVYGQVGTKNLAENMDKITSDWPSLVQLPGNPSGNSISSAMVAPRVETHNTPPGTYSITMTCTVVMPNVGSKKLKFAGTVTVVEHSQWAGPFKQLTFVRGNVPGQTSAAMALEISYPKAGTGTSADEPKAHQAIAPGGRVQISFPTQTAETPVRIKIMQGRTPQCVGTIGAVIDCSGELTDVWCRTYIGSGITLDNGAEIDLPPQVDLAHVLNIERQSGFGAG